MSSHFYRTFFFNIYSLFKGNPRKSWALSLCRINSSAIVPTRDWYTHNKLCKVRGCKDEDNLEEKFSLSLRSLIQNFSPGCKSSGTGDSVKTTVEGKKPKPSGPDFRLVRA